MTGHPGERLSAFLDGELDASERGEVERHLRECPACARHLEELSAVDALAREAAVEAPPGYFEALPGKVRTRLRGRGRRAPLALWPALAAAAAIVLAAVLVPITLTRQRSIVPSMAEEPAHVVPAPAPAPPATAAKA
ncbi:MAG TPA: zf-HC2 domain-containing protein, partial [Vicinamibacteria bacterium]|nr:zf-HC2 domain-containing protein [Vicinamibacteria bacterium]